MFFGFFFFRLNKFLNYLSEAGYKVSRTHFDPMGVRTNAPLAQFKTVLMKYSTPTYTGGQAEEAEFLEEDRAAVAAAMFLKDCPLPTHCAAE